MSLVSGGACFCATLLPVDPFQCENHLWRAGGVRIVVELQQSGNTGNAPTYGRGGAVLSLGLDKTGDLGSAGIQGVYFIACAPGAKYFEVRTVGAEGVFGEGALKLAYKDINHKASPQNNVI